MKAAITTTEGAPGVIRVQETPKPSMQTGWVLIRIRAAGLNRSELFTRQGHSPDVQFPRIQGIECVGEVEEDPSGRYAEYTLVPLEIVFPFTSSLPWKILGAIPEMYQTVSGSLTQALEVKRGETLLIRGGTSAIGLLACQLAKYYGLTVIATTRNAGKVAHLKTNSADLVLLDDGTVYAILKELFPEGIDKVLELVGIATLKDSLKCIRTGGTVCMTGILGGEWTLQEFTPWAISRPWDG